jgi:hypothetical protein
MILSKNEAVAIKPLLELSFDTTNYFILVSQNAAGLAEMNRFLTNIISIKPLPAQAPEFLM